MLNDNENLQYDLVIIKHKGIIQDHKVYFGENRTSQAIEFINGTLNGWGFSYPNEINLQDEMSVGKFYNWLNETLEEINQTEREIIWLDDETSQYVTERFK
jgi:hypothetical protein